MSYGYATVRLWFLAWQGSPLPSLCLQHWYLQWGCMVIVIIVHIIMSGGSSSPSSTCLGRGRTTKTDFPQLLCLGYVPW
jgi:hypothetical protein